MPRKFRSFATNPPKMLFQPINDQGGGNYRMMLPASLLRKNGYAVTQAHGMPVKPEALEVLDPDSIIVQQFQTEKQLALINAYKKTVPNAFMVYEIDDLFWAVPEDSFHRNNPLLPTSKSNIRTAAKLCDALTVTTPRLADEMQKLTGNRDVRVVPNLVPESFINAALNGRRSSDAKRSNKPRVGWAGGIGHGGDLKLIARIMREMGQEVQWVFFGMLPPDISAGESVEFYPGVPFTDYPRVLGTLNLDVALAPLELNDFNLCKSDLRVLEYGAAGFPVIASNVGTYDSCPGFVEQCENTPEAWISAIRMFIADPSMAEHAAEALHQWVATDRCLDKHLADRARAYLPPQSELFIPMGRTDCIGKVVTVGTMIEGLPSFNTVQEAWENMPGADILYARQHTIVDDTQAGRLIESLKNNASATPLNNDGIYPTFAKFVPMAPDKAMAIDLTAAVANPPPVSAPFPAGPCVLLSGVALARCGLPDEARFGSVEYSMADWGARCLEGGMMHTTATNVFTITQAPLIQPKESARWTLEHISMWYPGFAHALHNYQHGEALAQARELLDLAYHAGAHESPPVPDYETWYDLFESVNTYDRHIMAERQTTWENAPKISIVFPTYNTNVDHLRAALDSVLDQTYQNWELLAVDDASTDLAVSDILTEYAGKDSRINIRFRVENGHICKSSNNALEMATGDWVVFLDHDDTLAPQALYLIAKDIVEHPEVQFVYSDSDKIGEDGKYKNPYFTPDFSYELLLAQNYVTHLCAYRLTAVREIGCLKEGMEGSQDWDLALRYLEATCGTPPDVKLIRHIPHVLYHWRESQTSTSLNILSKPYAVEAGRKAVTQHLSRTKQQVFIGTHPVVPIFNLVRFLVPDPAPKVTVIIPTKDNAAQLDQCLSSLFGLTIYPNYNVIIVDNGSTDKRTKNFLKEVARDKRVHVVHSPGEFNYSAMNNRAVKMTDAEFICLLNDDVEVIERTWLADMVGLARRPGVGAVGAKLLYPDNTVQAAGIIFSPQQAPGQCALHGWQRLPMNHVGQTGRACITAPVIAVTGACMVVKRSLYQEMGGLDDVRFPVDWNDVDFCLKLHKAGYRNILAAQSFMRHHEGQTKKRLGNWKAAQMLAGERKLLEMHHDVRDPYINPRLEFHPHQMTLDQNPYQKPWLDEDVQRSRQLVINATDDFAKKAFMNGYIPFCARTEGHYLVLTEPAMENVRPVDLRDTTDVLVPILGMLGISEIAFCGIGDGTLGAVGYFATLAENGWTITYNKTEETSCGNEYGYYDQAGWRATWQRLLDATRREPSDV